MKRGRKSTFFNDTDLITQINSSGSSSSRPRGLLQRNESSVSLPLLSLESLAASRAPTTTTTRACLAIERASLLASLPSCTTRSLRVLRRFSFLVLRSLSLSLSCCRARSLGKLIPDTCSGGARENSISECGCAVSVCCCWCAHAAAAPAVEAQDVMQQPLSLSLSLSRRWQWCQCE